jgi:hypothetical protein
MSRWPEWKCNRANRSLELRTQRWIGSQPINDVEMNAMNACFAVALCVVFVNFSAGAGLAIAGDQGPNRRISPTAQSAHSSAAVQRASHKSCVARLLRRIVEDADVRDPQRLYIGSPIEDNGSTIVRVYWQEARAILLIDIAVEGGDDCELNEASDLGWYRAKARIDLDTDVVPTADDIGGSSYLVDKPWVDTVVADCLKSAPLVIEPSARE